MLESMIENNTATRAKLMTFYNFQSDTVMLSAEIQ